MASFSALGLAQESKFAREATSAALKKRVRDLVAKGVLDAAAIEAFAKASSSAAASAASSFSTSSSIFSAVPTRVVTQRPAAEAAFRHVPGTLPTARGGAAADAWLLGTRVSLGRAKWVSPTETATATTTTTAVSTSTPSSCARSVSTSASTSSSRPASIFSVADGRRLANEPVRHLTAFEAARAARVARHAAADAETALVAGIRLMPIYTPGRALLWGTVLAAWGTAAAVASSARALGVQSAAEAPEALRAHFAPAAARMRSAAEPWKGSLAISGGLAAAAVNDEGSSVSVLSRKLKSRLSEVQQVQRW
jgi:hypothetical protein